ncbi:MAG: Gfo/Idh/MocA family oxidoreductase [Phycisphaerae bacterium]|nr:Gfo/Idh/MocA family oxidoreductase [Phycisphaerae bacterium]
MQDTTPLMPRRRFLAQTAGLAAFSIVPRHVLGGHGYVPPSEKVNIACIGAGGMARADIQQLRGLDVNIVALCDVDEAHAAETFAEHPDTPKYRDFRRMLDTHDNDIDAVLVATPDHFHAVATMAAIQRGKHVYCEKPLAHSLYEVRKVTEAARQYGVATQLGNQGHSYETIRLFCEWIWDGAIGPVREVHACCDGSYSTIRRLDRLKETPAVPPTLDWNQWLGPAPWRAYNSMYLPGSWRSWTRFGTGKIGDWLCHIVDPVFWALHLGAPTTIEATVTDYDPVAHAETFPAAFTVRYSFPARGAMPPVTLTWFDGDMRPPRPLALEADRRIPDKGAVVLGDKGTMMYGSHGAGAVAILPQTRMQTYLENRPEKILKRSPGHHQEWLDACKGGPAAGSNFDYGGPLTEIALLGVIAIKLPGQTLQWDATRFEFTNSPEANALMRDPYRAGWSL